MPAANDIKTAGCHREDLHLRITEWQSLCADNYNRGSRERMMLTTRLRCSSLSRLFEQRFSLLEASGDQPREHISARINLIKEAISAIDLE